MEAALDLITRARAPTIFDGLSVTRIETGDDPTFGRYRLGCQGCGAGELALCCYEETAPDPSPYFAIEPGDIVRHGPIGVRCVACGTTATIFDPRKHGYDGVLNGGCAYSAEIGVATASAPIAVDVTLIYNIAAEELFEIAAEDDVAAADLFDAIGITGVSAAGEERFAIDFECA